MFHRVLELHRLHKTKNALKLVFRNTSGNFILLIIKWESFPYQCWNYQIKNSTVKKKNPTWDPNSSINGWVLGKRMKACAKCPDFKLPSAPCLHPTLFISGLYLHLCLKTALVSSSCAGMKRSDGKKGSPTGNCLSQRFTSWFSY